MKILTVTTIVGLLLFPFSSMAQGIGHGLELRLTSKKLVEVEPGKIVTASYVVSNRTGVEAELIERLYLPPAPEGWQTVTAQERSLILNVDEQSVRLVTFLVPKNCPAGKHDITYSLTNKRSSEVIATETFTLVVLPVIKLDATIEKKPEIIMAGDEYEVSLLVANNGNSTTPVNIVARTSPEYPVSVEPDEMVLNAGESQHVDFLVSTAPDTKNKINNVLEVSLVTESPEYDPVSIKRTVFVEILPKIAESIDLRHRVPTQMRFIAVGDQDEEGFQVEYSGTGSLDESGKRRIDFIFRGPDVQSRSIYGTRDELRLNYSDQSVNLMLGDRLYALSPLSERFAYGRGAEVCLHPGGLEIGSFYMETRWDVPGKREVGVYTGYNRDDKFRVRGNFLRKQKYDGSTIDGYKTNIYTAQTKFRPGPILNLGLEYGYSDTERDGSTEDQAHRITMNGQVSNRLWYTFDNTYAGSDFPGYYSDVLYGSGTIAAALYRNLRGNISYRVYENNLDLDPSKSNAPREKSFRGGLSYPFATGTSVSLDHEAFERKDELPTAQFDFYERVWRVGLGQAFEEFTIQSYIERALFQNNLIIEPEKILERYSIYAHYRPSARQNYSLYTRIGHNSFTGNPERTTSIGISTSFRVSNFLNLDVSYQKNNINSETLPRQDYLYSTMDIKLPNKHYISLKARWFDFEDIDRKEHAFFAAYTIPLDVPAMKKNSIGALKGRIIDSDRNETTPLPNVLLSVGDVATVTNESGEFAFPPMEPGIYSLQIDQRTMGMGKVASEALPLPVEVNGGEMTFHEIGISTACEISGKVQLFTLAHTTSLDVKGKTADDELFITGDGLTKFGQLQDGDTRESGVLANVLIEISNGMEMLRTRTDRKGRFSFKGIRSGKWHLKVYEQSIPQHHYIENATIDVDVIVGQAKEITVKVLPHLRNIRILEGGEIARE